VSERRTERRTEIYVYPFYLFISACKRQVPVSHDGVGVPITPDDLSTGKETYLVHARVVKRVEFRWRLPRQGSSRKRGNVRDSMGVAKTSFPSMN